jgi:cephalosporin hydroxylase
MKLIIDTTAQTLIVHDDNAGRSELPLYSRESFEIISHQWLRVGWNQKHTYTFSWFGRPVIQLPEDMVRLQEVIYRVRPDVIIETGVAHGGSLIFYASLCKAMSHGRIIGVDIEVRPHNRRAIEQHELSSYITLVIGDSAAESTVSQVRSLLQPGERALILLDSCHTKEHVRRELEAFHDLVAPDSYIVATDGFMKFLADVPRGNPEWTTDHPCAAAEEFAAAHPEFVLEQPPWFFNESELRANVTHWPGAWLRRKAHTAG